MDIYPAAKQRGKYQPLATDTEVNNCYLVNNAHALQTRY